MIRSLYFNNLWLSFFTSTVQFLLLCMSQNESFWICSPRCWGQGTSTVLSQLFFLKVYLDFKYTLQFPFIFDFQLPGFHAYLCWSLLVPLSTTFLASISPHPLSSLQVTFLLLDFLLLFSYMPAFDFHRGFLGHYDFSNFFFFPDEVHSTVQVGPRACCVISQMLDYRCGQHA